MKKMFISLVAALSLFIVTSTAYAWWQANAKVEVRQGYVEAGVYNGSSRQMYCKGYVYGRTYQGRVYRNYSAGWVAANGGWGVIGVRTSHNDPFVNGWADVQCRW